MAYAGIDVGTSGCKMISYDLEGNILASTKAVYKETGDNGKREINPNVVWKEIKKVITENARICPEKIEAIAVASLGESIVCLNDLDVPLCNSMVTGDKTGIAECKVIEREVSREEVMHITGLPLSEMYSLPKFVWMHRNTDIFEHTDKILFYEDFVGYMLTGERKVSYSSASRSMAFDIEKKCWCDKLLKLAGIRKEQMSEPVTAGTILGKVKIEIAKELGLSEDAVIVAGGHDQNCAALGSGIVSTSEGEDGQGTCEVMLTMLPGLIRTPYMIENDLSCVPYIIPDTYLTLIEVTTCGILMNWSRDTLFDGIREKCHKERKEFFNYMDSLLSDQPSELLVLPQFGSSGNPHINYDAKGLIWGLTIHTRPEEIYQAIKEGMAYQMLLAYETLTPLNVQSKQICVTGGGARSAFTLQMRANVFNKEMVVLKNVESGTLGCAIVAAKALGRFESFEEGTRKMIQIEKVYYPDQQKHEAYMKKFEQYKRLYEMMHGFK